MFIFSVPNHITAISNSEKREGDVHTLLNTKRYIRYIPLELNTSLEIFAINLNEME